MMKVLFSLVLLFMAIAAVSIIIIGLHRFFFKQQLNDLIEEATEEEIKQRVKEVI